MRCGRWLGSALKMPENGIGCGEEQAMAHIDTLATARRLELAGLPTEQARAVSEVIADAIRDSQPDWSQFATKEFVRAELKDLELRLAELLRSQMMWFFAMQMAIAGAIIAAFKLIP